MFVHGDNLTEKEKHSRKYRDSTSQKYLAEIREKYNWWHKENMALIGPGIEKRDSDAQIISKRVQLLSEYKDFIDQKKYAEHFDSRSNLHSSVLEEFMYYLFKDLVAEFTSQAWIGSGKNTFKDIFFDHPNFRHMVNKPGVSIETKHHDFVIGVTVNTTFRTLGGQGPQATQQVSLNVPAVAIECKTYLDKNMLEGASTSAEELKARNPNAIYIVVMEWIKLSEYVNLHKYKVDQIYILRKQKNTDREFRFLDTYKKNPIYEDVVMHLFEFVRRHLTTDWSSGVKYGLSRGYLL